ncbi:hypothetical protein KP509_01G016200 [Ceratopteris richardii]|uniref:TF-B3 domain-containing protein n=1 Tax=Ceratopteris richardii TaxID=49495 RepID=A0A8T2VAT2_CERRI|nr:hypothetical protein KP509_01G016200 [Ceratopteris richardii]
MGPHDATCCVVPHGAAVSSVAKSVSDTDVASTKSYSLAALSSDVDVSSSSSSDASTSMNSMPVEVSPTETAALNAFTPLEVTRPCDSASAIAASSTRYELSSSSLDRGSGSFSALDDSSPILEGDFCSMSEFGDVSINPDLDLKMKTSFDEMCLPDGYCREDSGCDDLLTSHLDELLQSDASEEFRAMNNILADATFGANDSCVLDDSSSWAADDALQGLESSFLNESDMKAVSSSVCDGEEEESASQMFARWLQSNAHWISLSDLRRIKLKTSTIDNVTRRLGGGKKGLMLFLKFVLLWVQNTRSNVMPRKCSNVISQSANPLNLSSPSEFGGATDISIEGALSDGLAPLDSAGLCTEWTTCRAQAASMPYTSMSSLLPRNCEPVISANACSQLACPDFHSNSSWPHLGRNMGRGMCQALSMASPLQPLSGNGSSHIGGACASDVGNAMMQEDPSPAAKTRAARKSRMERQKWSVRRNRKWSAGNRHQHRLAVAAAAASSCGSSHSNLCSWPQNYGTVLQKSSHSNSQKCNQQTSVGAESMASRQDKRSERDLRLLFHKELKQSDVGSLGRIVLPKAAETCLPPLELRDGVNLVVEDMNSTRVWNMRYRFWPNNRSRMYLLENTSDFVRLCDLKEGDYMLMYQDNISKRYAIRGVKGSEIRSSGYVESKYIRSVGDKLHSVFPRAGPEMSPEDSCEDYLFAELIEQSLEDFKDH